MDLCAWQQPLTTPSDLDAAGTSNPPVQRHGPRIHGRGKKRRRERDSQSDIDEMELSDRESDRDADVTSPEVSRPRRSARARHVVRYRSFLIDHLICI